MKRLCSAFVLVTVLAGCSGKSGSSGSKPDSPAKQDEGPKSSKEKSEGAIEVTAAQQANAGIRIAMVEPRSVARTLTVPGQIMLNEQRTAHISSYADGRVVDVLKMTGDLVERGTALAHLHSHQVHETIGALAQDFANLARQQAAVVFAQQKRDRYQHLYAIQAASLEQQQVSEQELVQAKTDLANAQAAVTMEREHLGDLLAVAPESLTPGNLYAHELVPINSPIRGTVISRSATPGMVLEPGVEAYTVSNLGEVWMVAAISETELADLRAGQRVMVRSDAWPGQVFSGAVTLIGASLDPATRTVQVRATLDNARGRLKPSMFVTASIDEAKTRSAIFVSEDALQEVNGVQVAFVTADGTHFVPRALKTLPSTRGEVEVTQGLRPGDHIAVAGAFLLKSDLLKGTIGEE